MRSFAAVAVIVACFAAPAAAENAAAPVGGEPSQSWEGFRTKAREDLKAVGVKIDRFEDRLRVEEEQVRARFQFEVNALRAQKAKAERLLDRLETATKETRKDLQAQVGREIQKLKKAYRNTAAKLNPQDKEGKGRD